MINTRASGAGPVTTEGCDALARDPRCISQVRAVIESRAHIRSAEPFLACVTYRAGTLRTMPQVRALRTVLGPLDSPQSGLGSTICLSSSARTDLESCVRALVRKLWSDFRPFYALPRSEATR
jgi:hypothetical protein